MCEFRRWVKKSGWCKHSAIVKNFKSKICKCISSSANLWLDKDIPLEFFLVIKRVHLNWFVFVCGYKLFQTFWFELWIMDYFISVLHNPQIELKKKKSKSFMLRLYNIWLMAVFSSLGLLCLCWKCVLCVSASLDLEIINVLNGFDFLKNKILAFWLVGNKDLSFSVLYPALNSMGIYSWRGRTG